MLPSSKLIRDRRKDSKPEKYVDTRISSPAVPSSSLNDRHGTHLDNGRILLGTLLELFIVQLGVLVQVHLSEQLVDSLQRSERRVSQGYQSVFLSIEKNLSGKDTRLTFSGVSSSSGSLTI